MDRTYQYSPLDPRQRQIRLIQLEPGAWPDGIRCSIHTISFDGQPVYDALSYVWGDPNNRKPIQLNGHSFEVTENLWIVLRRLRDHGIRRELWIDAICINQSDNEEKSQQVSMMRDIYGGCQEAIIWLGEDPDVAETGSKSMVASRACDMLELLGADRHFHELPCFSASDRNRNEISKEYTVHFEAFRKLVDAPWWKRIWVIQEMVLPKNIRYLYASEEFSYMRLRSVVRVLQIHGTTCCKQYRYTLRALAFDPILTFQEQVEPGRIKHRSHCLVYEGYFQRFRLRKSEIYSMHFWVLSRTGVLALRYTQITEFPSEKLSYKPSSNVSQNKEGSNFCRAKDSSAVRKICRHGYLTPISLQFRHNGL